MMIEATKRRSDEAAKGSRAPGPRISLRRSVASSLRRFRSGFSLTEVMFAVIVLGIGFILIAAIFPVSIAQSRLTVDETTAAAAARSALAFTNKIAEGGDNATINGPAGLMPTTDLYASPPASPIGANPTIITIEPGRQVRIGKVLAFYDDRLATTDAASVTVPGDAATGTIDYRNNLWNAVKGNIILPSDPRYAWIPLYRRDMVYYNSYVPGEAGAQNITIPAQLNTDPKLIKTPSPFAQVYFIPVAVRNRSTYEAGVNSTDIIHSGAGPTRQAPNLLPRLVRVQIRELVAGTNEYYAIFDSNAGTNFNSVVEGAYMIISDDKIITPTQCIGLMNGRSYRIGARRADLDSDPSVNNLGQVWELAPGGDFKRDPGANGILGDADDITAVGASGAFPSTVQCSESADAFIIGRNVIPGSPGVFEGVAQDVGVYVTFVKVN